MINDDDPTQSLPDKDKTTQPTIKAILDRMQGFETRISQLLESQIASLREEMNTQFRHLANKIDVLNEDSLGLRASQRDLLKRMGEIESRAS